MYSIINIRIHILTLIYKIFCFKKYIGNIDQAVINEFLFFY